MAIRIVFSPLPATSMTIEGLAPRSAATTAGMPVHVDGFPAVAHGLDGVAHGSTWTIDPSLADQVLASLDALHAGRPFRRTIVIADGRPAWAWNWTGPLPTVRCGEEDA